MPKRKRKYSTVTVETPKAVDKKKVKVQHNSYVDKSAVGDVSLKQKSAIPDAPVELSKPTSIRVIVGSYEKVLCGIDTSFDNEAIAKVFLNVESTLISA
jgi:hypothetical protein